MCPLAKYSKAKLFVIFRFVYYSWKERTAENDVYTIISKMEITDMTYFTHSVYLSVGVFFLFNLLDNSSNYINISEAVLNFFF